MIYWCRPAHAALHTCRVVFHQFGTLPNVAAHALVFHLPAREVQFHGIAIGCFFLYIYLLCFHCYNSLTGWILLSGFLPLGRGRCVLCDYTNHSRLVRRDSFLPITENGDKRVRCKYNWWISTFMAALFSTGNKVAAKFFKNGEFCKLLLYRVIENSYFFGLQKLRVVAPKPKLSGAKS